MLRAKRTNKAGAGFADWLYIICGEYICVEAGISRTGMSAPHGLCRTHSKMQQKISWLPSPDSSQDFFGRTNLSFDPLIATEKLLPGTHRNDAH